MATAAEIRAGLANAICSIKETNGYRTTMVAANVFARPYLVKQVDPTELTAYPRVFLYTEDAEYEGALSNQVEKNQLYTVITLFRVADASDSEEVIENAVEAFILDFEEMINRNITAGGALYWQIVRHADDRGSVRNQVSLVIEVSARYRRRLG